MNNEVRAARWRMVGDRWLRAAVGCACLSGLWVALVFAYNPNAFNPLREGPFALSALLAFFWDATRPPSHRTFKELTKAGFKLGERTCIVLIAFSTVPMGWAKILANPSVHAKLWTALKVLTFTMGFSAIAAALCLPLVLSLLALFDRWQVIQEKDPRRLVQW